MLFRSVVAVDAATGRTIWQTFTMEIARPQRNGKLGPSGAGIWSTPTIDVQKEVVYVSTGDNYSGPVTETSDAVLALDMKTGKLLWSRQLTQGDAYNSACNSRTLAPLTRILRRLRALASRRSCRVSIGSSSPLQNPHTTKNGRP